MPSPHTAEEVLKVVLQIFKDWNVPDHKIGSIITDNGSNMVKAFKLLQQQAIPDATNENNECDDVNESSIMNDHDVDIPNAADTTDSQSEEEEEEENDELELIDVEQEARDFNEIEFEHNITFTGYKRLSCFAHSLQLVVGKFDDCSVLFRRTVKKAKKLVSKFNKSTKATEKLIGIAGKKLIGDCPTRWSTTFLLINRLLEIKTAVIQILEDLGWDGL